MTRTRTDPSDAAPDVRARSVLVILVVKDGVRWLRECMEALSEQTHPKVAVIAVDNGSTDGSRDLLERALGPARVLSLPENPGLSGAVHAVLELPAAREADYVLVLHDDAILSPGAVEGLVDAAERIDRVGVAGPKVVDWEHPKILREVGRSTDRFGFPYSPLEDGEMDHGQYDRVREVLFVSSCVMLVSRQAWERAGFPDERLSSHHDDLDWCWRIRLAGFRVVMSPLAAARHRAASVRGERSDRRSAKRSRYFAERAALASMLKNYGVISLVWILPLYVIQGVGKIALYLVQRRFEDAYQVLEAWGWNLVRLPGTVARRVRAQSVRAVRDRTIRRYMAPASVRVRRWFETAGEVVESRRVFGADEEGLEEAVPLRARAGSVARDHPVAVAWVAALAVAALAERRLFGPGQLTGGALAAFPAHATTFFRELLSGVRTTGLGGSQAASPALGALGVSSAVALGNPSLAQKALLGGLPFVAGISAFRALLRQTADRAAASVAALLYGLSPIVLWAYSQGRLDVLVALAALPLLADRLDAAFGEHRPSNRRRFVVGTGLVAAVAVAFWPGALLGLAVVFVVQLVASSGSRVGGIRLSLLSLAVAAALTFPMLPALAASGGVTLGSRVGEASFASLARLVVGRAPGSWTVAWFLPAAALLSFAAAEKGQRRRADRALIVAVACLFLAWLSAAGYLPEGLSNPVSYTATAAVAEVALVGYGLASVLSGMGRQEFGARQLAAVALGGLLAGGLLLQGGVAAAGGWDVGQSKLPAAWPLVSAHGPPDSRLLWIGAPLRRPFPAPGGDPQGFLDAGASSLRYAVTDRDGASALDTGRGAFGPGYVYLKRVLDLIVTGTTRHGGAMLAPMGIRDLVAQAGDLPAPVATALDEQLDLNAIPAGGLVIYRVAHPLPRASIVPSAGFARASRGSNLLDLVAQPPPDATTLTAMTGGWRGSADGSGLVLIADQLADGWRLSSAGGSSAPKPAFGWANGFAAPHGAFTVTYSGQWVRTAEIAVLAMLWAAALWITRKRVDR